MVFSIALALSARAFTGKVFVSTHVYSTIVPKTSPYRCDPHFPPPAPGPPHTSLTSPHVRHALHTLAKCLVVHALRTTLHKLLVC